jgi:hypothetical protein
MFELRDPFVRTAELIRKKNLPPIVGTFLLYGVGVTFAIIVIIGIMWFVRKFATGYTSGPIYEHFESRNDGLVSQMQNRLVQIRAIKDRLQSDLDDLNDVADGTCSIMSQIRDSYIANNSAPTDESEYSLSKELQTKRMEERKRRAVLRFETEKKQFVALHGKKPVYECFAASASDVTDVETELRDEVNELITMIDSAEIRLAAEKSDQLDSLLGFNAKYLKKAVDATTVEGFLAELRGTALIAKADELLGLAATVHERIVALKKKLANQQAVAKSLNAQAANAEQGNVSDYTMNAAISKRSA